MIRGIVITALIAVIAGNAAAAQPPPKGARSGSHKGAGDVVGNYFRRPTAIPSAVARGKQLFSANCAFCHGSDAQGGEVGPNLLRSSVVLNDRNGGLIATVVQNGRVDKGMPKFSLNTEQVSDIAAFLHNRGAAGGEGAFNEAHILVGDPRAGKAYFDGEGHCTRCHSVTGDLAGIGAKLRPRELQDAIVTGGSTGMLGTRLPVARPRTVRVILSSGAVIEGRLESIDMFDVTLVDAKRVRRTIPRHGDVPKVAIYDPYLAHYDLLKAGRDDVIHDLTAYLAEIR